MSDIGPKGIDGPKGVDNSEIEYLKQVKEQLQNIQTQTGGEEDKIEYRDVDLFNNPFVNYAKKHMSQTQIDDYKKMGEKYFSCWDFEKGSPEEILDVAVAELSEAIKSGLHPVDLESNDIEILKTKLGKNWYERFGYTEEDLKKIIV